MKYSDSTGFKRDTAEEVAKLIDEVIELNEIVKEVPNKVKEQETENVARKVVKEEVVKVGFHPTSRGFKGQSPLEETKEPSSDSSKLTVGENEDYLDAKELILYLVKMRKSKRLTELLVSKLFKLIENKAGLQFAREDTDVIINYYISEIMFFSMRLLDLAGKIQKLVMMKRC